MKSVDWAAVEIDYRSGIKTLRAIGEERGISNVAILKRAKKDGWTRDLSERIRAKTAEKVSKAAVSKKVSKETVANETAVVEANASLQATILLAHRRDIVVLRDTVASMAAELGAAGNKDIQEALDLVLKERIEDLSNQQAKTALYKAFDAALALGGRSAAGKNLVASLALLIDKERQAFGIDKDGDGKRQSLGEFLAGLT